MEGTLEAKAHAGFAGVDKSMRRPGHRPAVRAQRVRIDSLAESVHRHMDGAIVCIDVFLGSSTVVTAVAQGRRTVLATTIDEARVSARLLVEPILAIEPGFRAGAGFEEGSGPLSLESGLDVRRPLVLTSPLAQMLFDAQAAPGVYVACLRNMSATAEFLAERHEQVALVGAGYGGEVRYEDQMVAAWMARMLIDRGFEPEGLHTTREVERWSEVDLSLAALGRGAEHLCRVGQRAELEFLLSRIDDLDVACRFQGGEMREALLTPRRSAASH